MKRAIKITWLQALRSDNYTQGFGALRWQGAYCPLGVLVDLYRICGSSFSDSMWEHRFLPEPVCEWADLFWYASNDEKIHDISPEVWVGSVVYLNDGMKLPFSTIAQMIEEGL